MPTHYVAPGVSGGDGSVLTPWNWDEMASAVLAAGDEVIVLTGTHSASVELDTPADFYIHGDFSNPRPVIDFGSGFTARCIDGGGYPLNVDYLEILSPNAVRTVDVDTWFNSSVNNVKGDSWIYTRAARRHSYCRVECPTAGVSGGSITQSYVTEAISTDGVNCMCITSCVTPRVDGPASEGSAISGSVIYGSGVDGGIALTSCSVSNTIIMNASVGFAASGVNCRADKCLFFNNTANTSGTVIEANNTEMDADPFEDAANGDFRLTTAAKAKPYANQLKAIMAGLVDVPGITTDSLADLVGGSGSGSGGGAVPSPFR